MVALPQRTFVTSGHAALAVEMVHGESAVTSATAGSPMKLLTPVSRGRSVWACTSSFGGGLVAGDETRLELKVGSQARCFLGTQASTKVYRNPLARACGHESEVTLHGESLLVFAPDPVQAFAGSRYRQRQMFNLAGSASLVLLDWLSSGRAACGERWEFDRFESRNDVLIEGRRVFMDSLRLESAGQPLTSTHRLGRFNCLATLLLLGPMVEPFARQTLQAIATRPVNRRGSLVISASPIGAGAVLRIAGESTELVGREIHRHLQPLSALLGDDPWARKW
jgi:urease accessory protein